MNWTLVVESSAESDIVEVYVGYEERLVGLGERYLLEVEDSLLRIKSNSQMYLEKGIRRSITHKFPYLVFYSLETILYLFWRLHMQLKTLNTLLKGYPHNNIPQPYKAMQRTCFSLREKVRRCLRRYADKQFCILFH